MPVWHEILRNPFILRLFLLVPRSRAQDKRISFEPDFR